MHLVFAIFLSLSNQSSSQGRALRRGPITGQRTGQPHTTMHQNSVSVPLDHPDLMDHLENQVSSGFHLSHATLEYRSQGPHPSLSLSSLLSPPLPSFPLLSTPLSLSSPPSLQVLEDRVAQAVQEHLAYQGSQDRKERSETPGTQVHNGDNPALKH